MPVSSGAPTPPEPATVPSVSPEELEELRKKAEERDVFLGDLQRARADYINLQRRSQRERENWSALAIQGFASELLVVMDQLDMAIGSSGSAQGPRGILEGISLVRETFLRVLRQHKIEIIPVSNQSFDPKLHEAIIREDRPELPDLTVIQELRKGYTMGGKVLRPAQVKVSRCPDGTPPPSPKSS